MGLNLEFKLAFLIKLVKKCVENNKFPVSIKRCLVPNFGPYSSNLKTFFETLDDAWSHGTKVA